MKKLEVYQLRTVKDFTELTSKIQGLNVQFMKGSDVAKKKDGFNILCADEIKMDTKYLVFECASTMDLYNARTFSEGIGKGNGVIIYPRVIAINFRAIAMDPNKYSFLIRLIEFKTIKDLSL
jgi:hypothetical protein